MELLLYKLVCITLLVVVFLAVRYISRFKIINALLFYKLDIGIKALKFYRAHKNRHIGKIAKVALDAILKGNK